MKKIVDKNGGAQGAEKSVCNTNKNNTDFRRKNWFFTWNNYTETDINSLLVVGKKSCRKYAFQEEIGKNGTKHIQGVLCFNYAMRFKTLKKISEKIHWEPCKNIIAASKYCQKMETKNGKTYIKGFKKIEIIDDIYLKHKPYKYQLEILDIIKKDPDDRKIYWYWEKKGNTGKTFFTKHLIMKHKAVLCGGKHSDAFYSIIERKKMNKPIKIVIFDIPRSSYNSVSYIAIENIKSGMFFSKKYESQMCIFNIPHIIVFCNFEPNINSLSKDRWIIREIKID